MSRGAETMTSDRCRGSRHLSSISCHKGFGGRMFLVLKQHSCRICIGVAPEGGEGDLTLEAGAISASSLRFQRHPTCDAKQTSIGLFCKRQGHLKWLQTERQSCYTTYPLDSNQTTAPRILLIQGDLQQENGHNYRFRDERYSISGNWVEMLWKPAADWLHQTSLDKTGSDAMNAAGDYSAAYCILKTDSEHSGHGMVRSLLYSSNST